MNPLRVPALLFLCIASLAQAAIADADLSVHAVEARAEIQSRSEGRKQTRLPSLQFLVHAEFACQSDAMAESLTISVADSHQRYTPAEGEKTLDAEITIPGRQIAPVATGDFCISGPKKIDDQKIDHQKTGDKKEDGGREELLLTGVATAQVSLRCRGESGTSVRFASLRLPLRLVCLSGDEPDLQEPSAGVSSLTR